MAPTDPCALLLQVWIIGGFFGDGAGGAVAGVDDGGRRQGQELLPDGGQQGGAVAARKVGAADAALEKGVAGEDDAGLGKVIADAARGMAGSGQRTEGETGQLRRHVLRLRQVAGGGHPRGQGVKGTVVHGTVSGGDPGGNGPAPGQVGHGPDVIHMRMGEQDGPGPQATIRDGLDDPGGLVAGVDEQQVQRQRVPDQIAVRFQHADRQRKNLRTRRGVRGHE